MIQKPAEGILRVNREGESWDHFHVLCDCGAKDHAIDAHISVSHDKYEPHWPMVDVEFFVTMYTPLNEYGFFLRLKRAIRYLFTGYLKMEHVLTLREEVALNFSAALVQSHRTMAKKAAAEKAKVKR